MGYALKLPGLSISNPSAPVALFEPFGVAGLSHRFEADTFAASAVGSTIGAGWLNKVSNTATNANSGTVLVGPDLAVDTRTTKVRTVDFTAANGDFGFDNVTQAPNTVLALVAYKGLTTGRIFELGGRRFQVYNNGWELSSADGTASPKLQLASQRPAADKLAVAVVTLSADGTADTITARNGGVTGTASGSSAKSANTRIRIGKGSGTNGDGACVAALAVWPRILTPTEISTAIAAVQARYGIA